PQAEDTEDLATEKVEFQKFLEMIGQSESPPAPLEAPSPENETPQSTVPESAAAQDPPLESKPAESAPGEAAAPAPEPQDDDWLGDLENLAIQEPTDSDWLDDADGHKPDPAADVEEMHIKMDRESSPLPDWMPKVQPQEHVEPPPLPPTQATAAEEEEDSAPDWLDKVVDTPQATLNKPASPPPQQRPVTEVHRPGNNSPQPVEPPVEESAEPDWLQGFNELSSEPQIKVDPPKPDNSFPQIAEEPSKPDWLKSDFDESSPLFPSEGEGNTRMLEESGLDWLSAAKNEPKSEPPAVSDVISKPISRDRPAALEPLTPAWMNDARPSSKPARRPTISPSQISGSATQEKPNRRRRKKAEPKISADPARPKPRRKQNTMGMFFLGLLSGILFVLIATVTALIITGEPGPMLDRILLAITSPDAFAAAVEISETPTPTEGTPVAGVQVATRTVTPTATFTPTPTLSPTPLPLEMVGPLLEEAGESVYTDPQAMVEQLGPVTASITDPVDKGQVYLLLGIAHAQLEQQAQADEYYEQVIDTLGVMHTNLTDVEAIGRANKYLVAAAMALERENDVISYNQGMIQTLSTRLDDFTTLRQFDLAYTYIDQATTQLEAVEQAVEFDLNREILDRLPPLLEQWTSAEDLSLAYHYLMNAALNIDAQIAADDYANRMIESVTPLLDGLNSADQIGPVYLRLYDAALTLEDEEGAKAYLQNSITRMIPFQEALTDEDELADLYIYLGEAESMLGTYAVAGVYYEKLIQIRYTPETIFLLASTLEQTDNKACAYKWYQILVTLKGPEVRKYRSASQEGITSINEFYEGAVPVCPQ
ncbi:MAG: hypothetical protein JXB38_08150, partial [Anaerolineales bacterium]|nr:hypothetical protein [Anaerolineales bacterium]